MRKFAIESIVQETPYLRARVHEVPMDTGAATENRQIEALLFNIKSQFKKLVFIFYEFCSVFSEKVYIKLSR